MPIIASVNYHVFSPEEQAYHIVAGGERGRIVGPEHVVSEIPVNDVRSRNVRVAFRSDSVAFLTHPTTITDFEVGRDWEDTYNRELADLLAHEIGAKETIVFDHTVRIDDPA